MKLILITVTIIVAICVGSSAMVRYSLETEKTHISYPAARYVRSPNVKREKEIDKKLKHISKLLSNLKKSINCSAGDADVATHCQDHWLSEALLRLSVRIASRKNDHATKREKKIHDQHIKINKLLEKMNEVTECDDDKKDGDAEGKAKLGAGKDKPSGKPSKTGETGKEGKMDAKKDKATTDSGKDGGKSDSDAAAATVTDDTTTDGTTTDDTATDGTTTDDSATDGTTTDDTATDGTTTDDSATDGSTTDGTTTDDTATDGATTDDTTTDDTTDTTEAVDAAAEGDAGDEEEEEESGAEEKESECDYSHFGEGHTMLLPPTDCTIHLTGITEEDKEEILRVHNNLRAKVARGEETQGNPGPQPPAADMRELVWNDQLAEVAEAWAKQCKQEHDLAGARKICSRNYFVNQNLHFYYGFSPEVNWENAINDWYIEVKDLPSDIVSSFRSLQPIKIGHYTQVVWGDTTEVGCGIVHYEGTIGSNVLPESKIYACNYGKAGNVKTMPIYTEGPAASMCPAGPSQNYPDLCAPDTSI